ncbi:MAG: nucleotidyltransferase domain-containing protein [Promethearchaeota archaeon]
MKEHHERAIKKFVEYLKTQEQYLALIIGGSIAKGLERDDSDIDVILVVEDDYYER